MSRVFRTFEDYKKHPDYNKCLNEWSEIFMNKILKLIPRDYKRYFDIKNDIWVSFLIGALSRNPNITFETVNL